MCILMYDNRTAAHMDYIMHNVVLNREVDMVLCVFMVVKL